MENYSDESEDDLPSIVEINPSQTFKMGEEEEVKSEPDYCPICYSDSDMLLYICGF